MKLPSSFGNIFALSCGHGQDIPPFRMASMSSANAPESFRGVGNLIRKGKQKPFGMFQECTEPMQNYISKCAKPL